MVEGDFFKVNSNFADAEEGTCMFLKEREAPIEPPKPLTEAEKSAKPPTNLIDKQKEDKIKADLKAYLVANQYDWYKDGKKKNGIMKFYADGTMTAEDTSAETAAADRVKKGKFKVENPKTIFIELSDREYTMEFQDSRAEAVLTRPWRNNPSKMRQTDFFRGRFNIKYNRFMQSEKCHNDYYVFAGQGDKGYYQLWELENVEGTKFFRLRNVGVED